MESPQRSRGARCLQKGAKLASESQQITRSAIVNEYKSSSTLAGKQEYDETEPDSVLSFSSVVIPEAHVNQGIYASVKSRVASGKGTKAQTSTTAQVGLQTQNTNKNGAST